MRLFITIVLLAVIHSAANATVRIVTCQNIPVHFLPVTVNAEVGDTIRWTWDVGVHDVGPINAGNIPNGAAMWNGPIDAGNLSLEYVVTVVGTYDYVCHPNTPHGENASIEVTAATGVQQYNIQGNLSAYPNPSNGQFQLEIGRSQLNANSIVGIFNLQGQMIYISSINNTISDIDLNAVAKGIYLVKFNNGEGILTKRIVVQ